MPAHPHHHANSHFRSGTLYVALGITAGYALVELIAGIRFHSLALMSDAGHMFSDAAALGLAAFAAWMARRPAGSRHTFGFARAEIVAAFINSLAMLIVVVVIAVEAVKRLLDPPEVQGLGVMTVAFLGLLVNLLVIYLISRGERTLNSRAATLHVFGDLIGSVAAITAGAVIYFTGWKPIDPLLSIVIALLILFATMRLLREAVHVLMEGVPRNIRLADVGETMAQAQGVRSVHDLHIWNISSGQIALSAHVDIDEIGQWPATLELLRIALRERFGIEHVTLQPEVIGGINAGQQARVRIVPKDGEGGEPT
ncbi:MAG TPA: cation diffusion facilitator family transporter [Burkholderiales bacterium]|nr:cation diffusion facilitator family transporter [Burkholderiales bacterium]